MVIFCKQCRSGLDRDGKSWKHRAGEPSDGHAPQPLAARRCRLFDPDVVGLPGYDHVLTQLVERERAMGDATETWRIGVYVFDGRIRGMFRYTAPVGKIPASSLFQPPPEPSSALLRDHPIVKERLARASSPA
jgi:hypothetical protein